MCVNVGIAELLASVFNNCVTSLVWRYNFTDVREAVDVLFLNLQL